MSDYPGARVARALPRAGEWRCRIKGHRRLVHNHVRAHVRRYPLCGESREGADRRHRDAEARHAHAVRLPRAGCGVAQVPQPRSAAAVPRFLRHADARAGIRARRRQPDRDAECARAAPDDEHHARDGSAECSDFEPIIGRYLVGRHRRRARIACMSRRPGRACHCYACTPRARTRGNTAMCSTTARSPTAFASSRSICPITGARRRPTAGG